MLDEQILKMAESNNINAEAVLASTESTISTGGKFSSLSTAFNIIFSGIGEDEHTYRLMVSVAGLWRMRKGQGFWYGPPVSSLTV